MTKESPQRQTLRWSGKDYHGIVVYTVEASLRHFCWGFRALAQLVLPLVCQARKDRDD